MTDADRMVVWLRETMDAAQADAEAATPGPWHVSEHEYDEEFAAQIGSGPGDADIAGHGYEGGGVDTVATARHMARHQPAAVLRRIAADRKMLEWCTEIIGKTDLSNYEEFGSLRDHPEALAVTLAVETICNLAEGWGWTEEAADVDAPA